MLLPIEYIALLGNDGGQSVRILKPSKNGELSSVAFDIPVDFKGGDQGVVITDAVFIGDDVHGDIAVFASSKDNDIVMVDLTRDPPLLKKLTLTEAQESTGGRDRKIEWAPETNFIWVSGTDSDEMYVVELSGDGDISKARVSRTLTGVPSSQLIFVENYERKRLIQMMATRNSLARNDVSPSNGLGTASLVLSIISIVLVLGMLANDMMKNKNEKPQVTIEDMKSLGSKITS